jgi:hypothetical protein
MKRYSSLTSTRRLQEGGSILIFATLAIFVLFGFMGLSLDAGYMYYQKRRMQTAADAGAIAGAQELLRNASASYATVRSAARKDTSFNGFAHGGDITVSVNMPPVNGPNAGVNGFVEVIIGQPQPTTFMKVLDIDSTTVMARSVAGMTNGLGCLYALNQNPGNTGPQSGITVNGNAQVNMNCGVYSNSNFSAVGGGCINSPNINYVNPNGYTNQCGTPNLQPSGPVVDPIASLFPAASATIATKNTCTYNVSNGYRPTDNVPLQPGVYCGGIKVTGSYAHPVVFQPGNYVMVGGVGLSLNLSGASVSGTGVTFFMTYPGTNTNQYAPVDISGNGTLTFSAPTGVSAPYRGLLFYQDPTIPGTTAQNMTSVMDGSGIYQGIIYFPTTNLQYSGSSAGGLNTSSGFTILVAYNIFINGGATINSNYTDVGGDPLKVAAFAE